MTFQGNQGGSGYGQPPDVTVRPNTLASETGTAVQGAFLTQAFFWMFAGLLVTTAVAALVQFNAGLVRFAGQYFMPLVIGQLVLAIGIQWGIGRISATIALGLIVGLYEGPSVAVAFLSAASMFGAAALYGYTTKRNLAGIGAMAYMAFVGLFVAMIVNFFLGSDVIGYVLSIAGVIIFTVLTAWDVQRISSGQLVQQLGSVEKAAVIGALHLYIDFVNLFLFLLRLFGDRR